MSEKKFTMTQIKPYGVDEHLDADFVKECIDCMKPGESVTIAREVEPVLHDYDVFYGSEHITQGWSQHQAVRAESPKDAVISFARNGNHSNGTKILVVGLEEDYIVPTSPQRKVGRTFEINHVSGAGLADFSYTHSYVGTSHYRVTEVPVTERSDWRQWDTPVA